MHLILKIFVSLVCLCCSNITALESFIVEAQHQSIYHDTEEVDFHHHHHHEAGHHHKSHHTTHHQGHHTTHTHDDGTKHAHGFSKIDFYRFSEPILYGDYSTLNVVIPIWSSTSLFLTLQCKEVERPALLYETESHWLMSMLMNTLNLSPNAPPLI